MAKYLVTGGAGFIGSHITEELVKKEREVLGYWRTELDRSLKRHHQELAAQTNDLQLLLERMDRRLGTL